MAKTDAQKKKDSILKKLTKKLPEGSVFSLDEVKPVEKIPTGITTLDYALDGGWPRGWQSMIFGSSSVGKTALTNTSMGYLMKQDPDALCCLIDLEKSSSPEWAEKFGVDPERLVVTRPTTTEEMITMTMEAIKAGIFDYVVVDSLGAGLLQSEIDNDKARMAGSAGNITRMVKAVNSAIIDLERDKKILEDQGDLEGAEDIVIPAVILINQARVNLSSMYGEDTFPGGKALEHMCGYIIQLKTSKASDDQIKGTIDGATMRVGWLVNAVNKKSKLGVPYKSAGYRFVFAPCKEHPFGIDNASSIADLALTLGIATVEGKTIFYKDEKGEEQKVVGRKKFEEEVRNSEILQATLASQISEIMSNEAADKDLNSIQD